MKDQDKLFIKIAQLFAEKSSCDRAKVGCVIIKAGRIISSGYNGSIAKQKHCDDVGHLMIKGHCLRTIHAEQNALMHAAKHGIAVDGCAIYTTHFPCHACLKLLIQAGIAKIYYLNEKPDEANDYFRRMIICEKIICENI